MSCSHVGRLFTCIRQHLQHMQVSTQDWLYHPRGLNTNAASPSKGGALSDQLENAESEIVILRILKTIS